MIEIQCGWVASASPNRDRTGAKSARSGREAEDRAAGRSAVEDAGLAGALSGSEGVSLEIVVCPPDRRRYDLLNMPYRLKALLDGVCDGLGIDDYALEPVTVRRGEVGRPGLVVLRFGGGV